MPMNIRLTEMKTPAGNKPTYTAAAGFKGGEIKKVNFVGSFGVNAGASPLATSFRGDPFTVVWTSTGLYTVTLGGLVMNGLRFGVKEVLAFIPMLQKTAASVLRAEPGLIVDASGTFQIRIVDAAGAVANPVAAAANDRVHFEALVSIGAL